MKKTYITRSGLVGLLFALIVVLAACSGNHLSSDVVEPELGETEHAATNDEQTAESVTKIVQHAMDDHTEVPLHPERIVVLDNGALDNLLALGVKPVGAATVSLDEPFFSYLADQVDGIAKVGTIDQPNLEAILTLQPDLILGSKDSHEAIYEKLSPIAPVVFTETLGVDWQANLLIHAEAVSKSAEAERLIADYEARVEQFKAELGEDVSSIEVSILRPQADHVRIYLSESYSGQFIEEIGFARPDAQRDEDFAKRATEEQIADMDGDVIFWFSRDPQNILSELLSGPLWSTLNAVQADKVFEVSAETWLSGMGIQSRNLMLDDLFHYLAE